ncbi:MAG: 30S ribosomal protein S27e [Halobacteriales archaeon]
MIAVPGRFLAVACPECGAEQIVFERASTTVACPACDATVATPSGGRADIVGEVVEVVESR